MNQKPAARERLPEAFRYCPSCRTANPSPGSVPFRCPTCGFAFFFGPVAAVGGLVINARNELLLVRRARDPGKGLWGLPGGFVDRGESVEEALRREVTEETQLEIIDPTLLTTGPNTYTYQGVSADVIDLFYCCRVAAPQDLVLAEEELDGHRWCVPGPEELENMAFESNRIAVELWLSRREDEVGQ